ncbi:MAG: hypothetical protein QME81_20040, partial [bacterium]|nr:hypothetical protein [bacterium]
MRLRTFVLTIFLVSALTETSISAEIKNDLPEVHKDLSFKKEVAHAIEKGVMWLKTKQNPKGYWSQPDYPALSALVLTAFMGEPSGQFKAMPPSLIQKDYKYPPFIQKGYEYLLENVRPDGGIYGKDLANYNTAVSMMAFILLPRNICVVRENVTI